MPRSNRFFRTKTYFVELTQDLLQAEFQIPEVYGTDTVLNFRAQFAAVFEFSRQNLNPRSGTVGTPPPPPGPPGGSRPLTPFTPMKTVYIFKCPNSFSLLCYYRNQIILLLSPLPQNTLRCDACAAGQLVYFKVATSARVCVCVRVEAFFGGLQAEFWLRFDHSSR